MMNKKGQTKLTEECGELVTVLAKIDAFGSLGEHWDGKGDLKTRLENEIADVKAACNFLTNKLELDAIRMSNRQQYKQSLFGYWDRGGKETSIPWPENGKFGHLSTKTKLSGSEGDFKGAKPTQKKSSFSFSIAEWRKKFADATTPEEKQALKRELGLLAFSRD